MYIYIYDISRLTIKAIKRQRTVCICIGAMKHCLCMRVINICLFISTNFNSAIDVYMFQLLNKIIRKFLPVPPGDRSTRWRSG
jgi:hypothetical protein